MKSEIFLTFFAIVLGLAVGLGISALIAWLLSIGIAFAFDYHLGFLKTWVALFVIQAVSKVVFSGMKRKEAE